jgi:hypothetical protein
MTAGPESASNDALEERCSYCGRIPAGPVELVCTSQANPERPVCICKACVDHLYDFFKRGRYGPWARSEGVTL